MEGGGGEWTNTMNMQTPWMHSELQFISLLLLIRFQTPMMFTAVFFVVLAIQPNAKNAEWDARQIEQDQHINVVYVCVCVVLSSFCGREQKSTITVLRFGECHVMYVFLPLLLVVVVTAAVRCANPINQRAQFRFNVSDNEFKVNRSISVWHAHSYNHTTSLRVMQSTKQWKNGN